jgi:hypothetical protein
MRAVNAGACASPSESTPRAIPSAERGGARHETRPTSSASTSPASTAAPRSPAPRRASPSWPSCGSDGSTTAARCRRGPPPATTYGATSARPARQHADRPDTHHDVQRWYLSLADRGLAAGSVKRYRRRLSEILRFGMQQGCIGSNAVDLAKLPPRREARERGTFTIEGPSGSWRAAATANHGGRSTPPPSAGVRPGEPAGCAGTASTGTVAASASTGPSSVATAQPSSWRTEAEEARPHRRPRDPDLLRSSGRREVDLMVTRRPWPAEWAGPFSPPWRPPLSATIATSSPCIATAGVPRIVPQSVLSCAADLRRQHHHRGGAAGSEPCCAHYAHLVDRSSPGADAWAEI